jgi:hypothetical protein
MIATRKILGATIALGMMGGIAGAAQAAVVFSETFDSAAFRAGSGGDDLSDRFGSTRYYNTNNVNGWTFTGFTHIAVDNANPSNGALHLNEAAAGMTGGTASIDLNLAANTTYKLSFLLSGDNVPGDSYDFIASIAGSTFTTQGTVGTAGSNPGVLETYSFTTGAAGSYTLALSQAPLNGGAGSPIVDNISIASVPESATWMMMIGGFGMVGAGMRRRKVAVRFA